MPVGALARHRVVAVDHAHRPGHERDRRAGEVIGVSRAVEALVVVAHAGDELVVEQRPHDLGRDAGVLAHELPLLGGQRTGLEQHAVGDADLADVVQEGNVLELVHALLGPAELLGEHGGVGGDAAGVTERVVVLGRQRRRERPQVGQVQALDLVVELGVLDRQGHELADGFSGGDIIGREVVLDVVEKVDEADHPVAGDQRQRDLAALTVRLHGGPLLVGKARVVEAARRLGATRVDGHPVEAPVGEMDLLAYPASVVGAVERRGQADQAIALLEPVDVAVGDGEGRREAARGRLQHLVELDGRRQLEARVEKEPETLLQRITGRTGRRPVARRELTFEVLPREAALAARGAP